MGDERDSRQADQESMHGFMAHDFNQCFEQMRHYNGQIVEITKFSFLGYTGLLGVAVGLFEYGMDKGVDLRVPVGMALLVGVVFGVFAVGLIAKNRAYFVKVARYVNEQRAYFLNLGTGFQNVTGMHTDCMRPRVCNYGSSQLWLLYVLSALNGALVAAALCVSGLISQEGIGWAVFAALICMALQVGVAVFYLRGEDKRRRLNSRAPSGSD